MRKILKIIFCELIYHTGVLSLYLMMLKSRQTGFPVVIINYHGFYQKTENLIDTEYSVSHRISDFREECQFLKRFFDIVSLDEAAQALKSGKIFPRPTVAITVDDGYKNNFDLLYPVVRELGVPVTIFLTAGLIGTTQKIWVNQLAEIFTKTRNQMLHLNGNLSQRKYTLVTVNQKREAYAEVLSQLKDMDIQERKKYFLEIEKQLGKAEPEGREMLTWDEVRTMAKNNISFGAHTCFHPILTNMLLKDAKKEILDSKKIIEKELNIEVKHFAFPNGRPQDFNEELKQYCKAIGFESIGTCDYGHNDKPEHVLALRRIGPPRPLSLFAVNVVRAML